MLEEKANKRNYTKSERAIILIGVLAGKSLSQINSVLVDDQEKTGTQYRVIPSSSFDMLSSGYKECFFQSFLDCGGSTVPERNMEIFFEFAWDFITKPKSMSQLKNQSIECMLIDKILDNDNSNNIKIDSIFDLINIKKN